MTPNLYHEDRLVEQPKENDWLAVTQFKVKGNLYDFRPALLSTTTSPTTKAPSRSCSGAMPS
jgi:hypothetical protein